MALKTAHWYNRHVKTLPNLIQRLSKLSCKVWPVASSSLHDCFFLNHSRMSHSLKTSFWSIPMHDGARGSSLWEVTHQLWCVGCQWCGLTSKLFLPQPPRVRMKTVVNRVKSRSVQPPTCHKVPFYWEIYWQICWNLAQLTEQSSSASKSSPETIGFQQPSHKTLSDLVDFSMTFVRLLRNQLVSIT